MGDNQTIFLTGISGLLGTNLAHRLLSDGYNVLGLIRNKSSFRGKQHLNLRLIEGDLSMDFSLIFQEVDIVIHAAAETRQSLIKYSDYEKVNIMGTSHLYHMAIAADVKQFVYVSTANTIGYASEKSPGLETDPMRHPFLKSFYGMSKRETEDFLLSSKGGPQVLIINPTFMIGPYDSKPSSGKIILMALARRIIWCPPGGKNFVHVYDVVESIINIMAKGRTKERYLIAGENLSFRQFFTKLIHFTGQKSLLVPIPKFVLLILGYIGDLIRFAGIRSNLGTVNIRTLFISNFYSNEKSISELGLKYKSIDVAIADAVDYFNVEKMRSKASRNKN